MKKTVKKIEIKHKLICYNGNGEKRTILADADTEMFYIAAEDGKIYMRGTKYEIENYVNSTLHIKKS